MSLMLSHSQYISFPITRLFFCSLSNHDSNFMVVFIRIQYLFCLKKWYSRLLICAKISSLNTSSFLSFPLSVITDFGILTNLHFTSTFSDSCLFQYTITWQTCLFVVVVLVSTLFFVFVFFEKHLELSFPIPFSFYSI